MHPNLPPELSELLTYLAEIGYGDLYLQPGATASPPTKGTAKSTASSRSPGAVPAAASPTASVAPAELAALAQQAAACTACRLSSGRQHVVFGSGNPRAALMFVGEGPGAEEDRQGLPFVGAAGALLTRIIEAISLTRDQVYIANMVKCRPPGNRDPEPDELAACRAYLDQQIDLIQPRVIVALGRIAAQALLHTTESLGRLRGQWHFYRGAQLRVTYHPAFLLRYPENKKAAWEDMQLVRDLLRQQPGE